jgi:solute carrier family 39 (zinc transporter), member 1/2/3
MLFDSLSLSSPTTMRRSLLVRVAAVEDDSTCSDSTSSVDLPLRIASIFVILAGASFGALFPVLSRRTKYLRSRIPHKVFDTAKYFGSGVIVSNYHLEDSHHL